LCYPFGDDVKVFRIKNKMFATIAHGSVAKSKKPMTKPHEQKIMGNHDS